MILASIRMIIPRQKRGEVLELLRFTAEGGRILPGRLSCHIYEDLLEDNVIMFEERWRSEEEMEGHLRSEEYLSVLLALEIALQHPEVRFTRVLSASGIETIEKARASSGRVNRP
jgi:quinol monooxygenase YgiN